MLAKKEDLLEHWEKSQQLAEVSHVAMGWQRRWATVETP
jgi:hypothetical protein